MPLALQQVKIFSEGRRVILWILHKFENRGNDHRIVSQAVDRLPTIICRENFNAKRQETENCQRNVHPNESQQVCLVIDTPIELSFLEQLQKGIVESFILQKNHILNILIDGFDRFRSAEIKLTGRILLDVAMTYITGNTEALHTMDIRQIYSNHRT